ncbi:MAG: hypothetical protein R3B13_37505 [Polyangiaceae bacterium]
MLSQLKRHEIQVLLRAGFRPAEVAKRAQVSDDSVRRIQQEDAVEHTDDAVAHAQRRIGRPSKAALLADRVKAWIAEEPELPTQELLRRAKEAGYAGKKTAFYTRRWSPASARRTGCSLRGAPWRVLAARLRSR